MSKLKQANKLTVIKSVLVIYTIAVVGFLSFSAIGFNKSTSNPIEASIEQCSANSAECTADGQILGCDPEKTGFNCTCILTAYDVEVDSPDYDANCQYGKLVKTCDVVDSSCNAPTEEEITTTEVEETDDDIAPTEEQTESDVTEDVQVPAQEVTNEENDTEEDTTVDETAEETPAENPSTSIGRTAPGGDAIVMANSWGVNCNVQWAGGGNWNINCWGNLNQSYQVVGVRCNQSGLSYCVPSNGGTISGLGGGGSIPSSFSVNFGGSCGTIQVDVMVGGMDFNTNVVGGNVHSFGGNCSGGTNGGSSGGSSGGSTGTPTHLECRNFSCTRVNGAGANQCTGQGTACQPPNPEISITKSLTAGFTSPFEVGDDVSFSMVITNTGNVNLTNIIFQDEYDTDYLSYQNGTGTYSIFRASQPTLTLTNLNLGADDGELIISFGNSVTLAPNDRIEITIPFEAVAHTQDLPNDQTRNVATVIQGSLQDHDDEYVEIEEGTTTQPSISITKSLANGQAGIVEEGDTVNFFMTIRNDGNTNLSNIVFTDTYDTDFLSYTNNTGSYTIFRASQANVTVNNLPLGADDGTLTIDFGAGVTLAPNDRIEITIPFTAEAHTQDETNDQTINEATVTSGNLTDEDDEPVEVVEPGSDIPAIDIQKNLAAGYSNPFDINDLLVFQITIRNTGNTVFDVVEFTDNFNNTFIQYQSGTATLNGNTVTLTAANTVIGTGTITINDLTQLFGENLDPNELVTLNLTFRAVGEGTTTNIAIVDADGTIDQDDQDVIIIDDATPVIDIDKVLLNDQNDDRTYIVGEEVIFTIRIENKGNTTFDVVRFEDTFDPAYLQVNLADSYIVKSTGGRVDNLTTLVQVTGGNMVIPDITTTALGNLAPGQFYDIIMYFTALQSTENLPGDTTNNFARVIADGLIDEDGEDVIIIEEDDVEVVGCNQLCGGNLVCDTTQDLVCVNLGAESRCRLETNTSSLTCDEEDDNAVIDIDKVLLNDQNDDGTFIVGEDVIFTIRIENKGDTTFNVVRFEDTFDPNYLQVNLAGSYIVKNTGGRIDDLTGIVQITGGNMVIPDITTTALGNLAPGQFYDIIMYFRALQSTEDLPQDATNNFAVVTADGLRDEDGEDVIIIDESVINIVSCNQTCGGLNVCDSSQDLICVNLGGESRCRLDTNIGSQTCGVAGADPELSITKRALIELDDNGVFEVGEQVSFSMIIRNTGNVELTRVRFIDTFDANFLTYLGGTVERYNGSNVRLGGISNITPLFNINQAGYLEITNLAASALGTLQPGDYYAVTLNFLTRLPGSTTNIAITEGEDANGNDAPRVESRATININNLDTDF
jgi:uncharacterized repeat protein (TIGR01451 family)